MADDKTNRSGCNSINQKEIQEILEAMNLDNISILYVKDNFVAGICEVAIGRENQPAIILFDGRLCIGTASENELTDLIDGKI